MNLLVSLGAWSPEGDELRILKEWSDRRANGRTMLSLLARMPPNVKYPRPLLSSRQVRMPRFNHSVEFDKDDLFGKSLKVRTKVGRTLKTALAFT